MKYPNARCDDCGFYIPERKADVKCQNCGADLGEGRTKEQCAFEPEPRSLPRHRFCGRFEPKYGGEQ